MNTTLKSVDKDRLAQTTKHHANKDVEHSEFNQFQKQPSSASRLNEKDKKADSSRGRKGSLKKASSILSARIAKTQQQFLLNSSQGSEVLKDTSQLKVSSARSGTPHDNGIHNKMFLDSSLILP